MESAVDSVISVQDVHYSYGTTKAVAGVSFTVHQGEVVGFLGPNGAGKSTTVKMLTGMLRPDTGSIRMLGHEMKGARKLIQARIGVCFEEKNLYLDMTGEENLLFFARLFGVRSFDAMALLKRVDLAERARERVKRYSKGMRQRLMIARSLINTPDILFLDEPTDGLDPVSARSIRRIVEEESSRGAAVFLTTHDMHEADQLSHRVAFINSGSIVAFDSPEELKLKHGRRSVRIRIRKDGVVDEKLLPLGGEGASEALRAAADDPGLMTIHTEEATLEDVFVKLTGRGLS